MELASCTTAVVTCDDTGTTTSVWPVVAQVVLVVLVALVLWWALRHRHRHRSRRPVRAPQRRAHVSASGELVSVVELPRG
jgi:membrane protein implicated in regulation of membrane protease activity